MWCNKTAFHQVDQELHRLDLRHPHLKECSSSIYVPEPKNFLKKLTMKKISKNVQMYEKLPRMQC